ncbi:Fec I like protein [Nitrobacter winogradskyi Nb-255]|jgi:RNA polymerase sigma-70 factor (ECF subfamily)|uniref:Fec I like protein n=1 Tax=Nitrobacter winogradskyi (strain ATCC 25391 / DSM 10237 / CIP 104748 / NCIMB 11846 / Nb-255) TaxID=323098 RepID=Q3SQP9_NITWN|nr:sigma-70 family RNA polymerase sigma factor [Nitrobacter winogradskyi]ABA05392.1 Fec I like protein [Nitrobacter winogradskyi Nb-255]
MSDERSEPKRTWEASLDGLRPRLIRVAYRMLGSVTDAEDVVQEAFLRSLRVHRDDIRDAEAWLRRVVTRLSLNHLRSARRRRETYIGPWLPEPVIEPMENAFDDVTLPLLLALERLSPLERAAFLLHDVFGMSFDEIARTLDRTPAACRQLASRARAHVRVARPRFPVPKERGIEIAEAFFAASRSGDIQTLRSLLADDVTAFADGGGKTGATLEPVVGCDEVARLHEKLAALFAETPSRLIRYGLINGLPGFVTIEKATMLQTTALELENDKIVAIYVVQNPDKLQHLAGVAVH